MSAVEIRQTTLTLPAYAPGPLDPEPPLLPGFGPRGLPIYPYPTIESYATSAAPRSLRAVVLENQYLRLTFLPELNARLWSIYDKLARVEVLYANPQLKPGLVGLRGVWHATGLEVNFPGSHTVTTADEVPHEVIRGPGGAATFVAWDVEAVSGLSWRCATTLAAETAAVDMVTDLANPGELPARYYFWVNAAFPIKPGSRYVFPPSTQRIFLEGGEHPGELGYLDYPQHEGVDVSVFENLRHHAAHFATTPDEGFFGLHHPSDDTGVAHVADPHLVCGRKIWSWGFAPDGQVWHDALTDTGGPYCEVQSGPLRSQIEYRSIAPGQVITQRERWIPLRGLGGLSWATNQVAASWRYDGDQLLVRLLAPTVLPGAVVGLGDQTAVLDLGPAAVEVSLPAATDAAALTVQHAARRLLRAPLRQPRQREWPRLRAARVTAGQRGRYLEWQGRWEEAWRAYRDGAEEEAPAAAGLARQALLRADAAAATQWAVRAVNLDWQQPEALLTLALAARLEGDPDVLRWSAEQLLTVPAGRADGLLLLTDLALAEGDWELAAARAEQLQTERADLRATGRAAHAARRGGWGEAWWAAAPALLPWHLDPLLAAEAALCGRPVRLTAAAQLRAAGLLRQFGDPDAAARVLRWDAAPSPGTPTALLACAAAWVRGEASPPEVVWEVGNCAGPLAITVLRHCLEQDASDEAARYHLANALAALGGWEEAATHWAAASDGPWAPEALRNLGLWAWQIGQDRAAAEAFYRQAVAAGGTPRTVEERDRLLAELGRHAERPALLLAALGRFPSDPRLPLRLAAAELEAGDPQACLRRLTGAGFQLYEGGYLPQALWTRAHRRLAEAALTSDPATAAQHYAEAARYPAELGVGAPAEQRHSELWFRCGEAWQAAGRPAEAQAAWQQGADPGFRHAPHPLPAAELIPELPARGVSAGRIHLRLWQALCLHRLGRRTELQTVLQRTAAELRERQGAETWQAALEAVASGRVWD
ncbi:MAG: DUF5107 domain-containing protein [Fimbriimonadaceae bacterium]|nr:DUF5107 domain-containing protein [Fimbriimonadaceae bacterium]